MQEYYIAFWNLENLFDVENSSQRPQWLQEELARELRGWDESVLELKVEQLARIIRQMNGGRGPDMLCVCELENKPVLERLLGKLLSLGRTYDIAHHDTSDQRGIDVAFIYDRALFSAHEQFSHVILKRAATRDMFQVNFKTAQNKLLILVGNHWPSRSGGQYESEPYRMTAAETLSYWAHRILEIQGRHTAIIFMGDFNDEPFNRAVTDYALAGSNLQKVLNADVPRLVNLMWKFHGEGIGTHYFNNFPNVLDQFWLSRGLFMPAGDFALVQNSVAIERFPEMVATGMYPRPRRFSRPSAGDYDPTGYSDHFPISVRILEK